jgi:transposase
MELLTSISGIGVNIAMGLLTEIGDVKRFHKETEFASYLGLIPTSHSSGDKIVYGEKTFRGNKDMGPQIIEAAWVAISRDRGLGCAYTHYKKKMIPQKAIIRVARKLSNIILAVLKTGKKYETYQWNEMQ